MAEKSIFKHWPTMLLGFVVAAILLVAVFSFQLAQTHSAVVTTFGRPALVTDPGLHFRWPFPFQKVYRFDHRVRCFAGGEGKLEETMTGDGHNLLVGIYVNFRIKDAKTFFVTLENLTKAENQLNSWMRGAKNAAFGRYRFNQIINTDPRQMKLGEIEQTIKADLARQASAYGIEVISVGVNTINVPKTISEKVFDRMIAERKRIADKYIAEGNSEARKIRIKADSERTIRLAEAEAKAKEIRAQGDAEAAQYYAEFRQDPELAEFLRKLDALRTVMKGRTTLVVDTATPPFDLLKPGAEAPKATK
ncbi:MAG: protease modulator HflC [Lentisphaeria bacterium]|nr:protease modulator HflC [Lentisphaeria bacterium]